MKTKKQHWAWIVRVKAETKDLGAHYWWAGDNSAQPSLFNTKKQATERARELRAQFREHDKTHDVKIRRAFTPVSVRVTVEIV